LGIHPDQLADTVLIAGDPGRIERISARFDRIEMKHHNREFITHTGELNGHRITALATGIGTDNIDIVLNELDVLVNVDLQTREVREETRSLSVVRLGTCGALRPELTVDSLVVSEFALGLDNVVHYYGHQSSNEESDLLDEITRQCQFPESLPPPYIVKGDELLVQRIGHGCSRGITVTAGGFYGPQGRYLRLIPAANELNEHFSRFEHNGLHCLNYEMETSALYGLGAMLGHRTCTVCTVVANRYAKAFSSDHEGAVENMIDHVLSRIFD
jgi:uridine phosphorylase